MYKVINLTNKYIVLTTPLILFTLLSSIYLAVTANGGKLINLLFAIVLFTFMTAAFIAGWFNMIKIAVTNQEKDESISLMQEFTSGVGEYILPSLVCFIMAVITSIILLIGSYLLGANFIGDPGVTAESLSNAMQNQVALKTFIASLTTEQLTKISMWNFLILGTITLTYFLMFLYLPVLFFKNKNPFIAYFISLKDLFSKKIFKTSGIFLLIFVLNFFISVLSTLFASNVIVHFIITLANFYFITAACIGVFYYYHKDFITPMIGNNIDVQI